MKKKQPTKSERAYMDKVAAMGCSVCQRPAEIHHNLLSTGLGQRAGIIGGVYPLCPEHHRIGGYGMAIHAGKVEWQRIHGTEQYHLDKVEASL